MPLKKYKTIRAIKVNPSIRASYRRAVTQMIDGMAADVEAALLAEYDSLEWRLAQDSAGPWKSPAQRMEETLFDVMERWIRYFTREAPIIATKYIKRFWRRIRSNRRQALKDAGITIKINPSRLTDERFQAVVAYNVDLIRTIPAQYAERAKASIYKSLVSGKFDRRAMADELRDAYGMTEKRAVMIVRDQSAKAVQALAECTDRDLGITEGVWVHVPGRFTSRPTHVDMDGKPFKLSEGMYDPEVREKVKPGELINCACIYRPVLPEAWKAS